MGKITDPTSASYADLKEARADLARLRAENETLRTELDDLQHVANSLRTHASAWERQFDIEKAARAAAEAKAARLETALHSDREQRIVRDIAAAALRSLIEEPTNDAR